MTLADLIPSLRSSLPHPLEPWLWPASTQHRPGGDLCIGGASLTDIAERCGTPIQVLDLDEFRGRCTDYQAAFYDSEVAYAGRALLTVAAVHIADAAGLSLTVSSADELEVAERGRFPMERVIVCGRDKSLTFLKRARLLGVGRIVVSSIEDIEALAKTCSSAAPQRVLLHVASRSSTAARCVRRVVAEHSLALVGLHCTLDAEARQGSRPTSVTPYGVTLYERAAHELLVLRAVVAREHGLMLPELHLGGGHAIAHHPGEVPAWPWEIAAALRRIVREDCAAQGQSEPRVTLEPGHAIAGPCGITVYRVTQVSRIADRIWITVDGGLRDHLAPAERGRRYTARLLGRLSCARDEHLTIVGRQGSASEVLIEDALLPTDIHPGDLLAVPVTGAQRQVKALQVPGHFAL